MSNNQPIHRIRIGAVSVAIFINKTDDDNTQFDRSYRVGDEWKHTRSLGKDDLLVVGKLADQAPLGSRSNFRPHLSQLVI